jgi:Carboxypeptidase regulatory-like domain
MEPSMKRNACRLRTWASSWIALALVSALAGHAYAQGGGAAASLSGTVTDSSGAVLPGANIVVKNNATAGTFTTVSNEEGTFTVPAVNAGTYTVTVTLVGFKTVVLNDVVVNAGVPATVRARLDVGGLEETVTVAAASDIIQTQTAAVTTTMDLKQITSLPLTSRNALDFVANLPGVNTPGTRRDSRVNGLPQGAINITVDGMSMQDNHLKTTDGFFARVNPRLDSVSEVTVSTAAQDAAGTGMGAVQIRFVTRSGTNDLRGSGYYYLQHYKLNAHDWFDNRDLPPDPRTGKAPKAEDVLHQPGISMGGPISIPGLFSGRDKAFFFFNYEESRSPGDATRDRIILHPRAESGLFRYSAGGQVREVNVLNLAAANGHVSAIDPMIGKLLADIRTSTTMTGQVADQTDPLLQRFTYQFPTDSITRYPSGRVDVNLSERHRLYSSFNYNKLLSDPDLTNNREARFPGFPGSGVQDSIRYTVQGTLRSTLGSNVVNELRIGGTGGRTLFTPGLSSAEFGGTGFGSQSGYLLDINGDFLGIANAHAGANNSSREASTKVVDNVLNWIKGSHSLQMGGSWTQVDLWIKNQTHVPTIAFMVPSEDPANAMFTTTNFPGASTTQLNDARELYATLTGRINSINSNARLNEQNDEYAFLGEGIQRARMRELGFYIADTWRWRPNLTFNLGLRYELQLPFYPRNNSYSTATLEDVWGVSGVGNLFMPGFQPGRTPQFSLYEEGTRAYNIDKNNFAPNVGLAWTPSAKAGIFRRLLGAEGDSVLRAGYSLSYSRPGTSDFSSAIDDNPGVEITTNRNHTLGNLGTPGAVFLRNPSQLGPPAFPTTREYPLTEIITGDIHIFDPNLQTPYAQSWTAGWQRKITNDMAVEIRYVGTRGLQQWVEHNYNEVNIVENGFLDEFRLAQQNLQANLAAGRGASFRYAGTGTGTAPLPILLAYFTGLPAGQAGDPARYTTGTGTTLFQDSTFLGFLATYYPQPHQFANALDSSQTRIDNALRAGLPANFLVANPHLLGGAEITANGGYTRYDALQLEWTKRLSRGLQVQGNYTFGKAYISDRYSYRTPLGKALDAGGEGGVTHAFNTRWVYELPFGRDRRVGAGSGALMNRLIGGWSFDGIARIQSGRLIDFGNVRLVGMSRAEFEDAFKLRFDDAGRAAYMLPLDIVDNTVRAFSVSATSATGYGDLGPPTGRYLAPANGPDCIEVATNLLPDVTAHTGAGACGERTLVVTGPEQVRFDLSLVKRIPVVGRLNVEFRGEFINAFNHPWFTPVAALDSSDNERIYTNPDNFRVRDLGENSSRIIRLVTRVTW